jgi:hypothetical protein
MKVSTAVSSLSSQFGSEYQAVSARAAALHSQFIQALNAGAGTYVAAEAANTNPLRAPPDLAQISVHCQCGYFEQGCSEVVGSRTVVACRGHVLAVSRDSRRAR